jgi:hypothetical protein
MLMAEIPGTNTFECDNCHGVFDLGDDEEARSEAFENGWNPNDDCGIICDECYEKVIAFIAEERK